MSVWDPIVHAMQEADHAHVEKLLHKTCHEFMERYGEVYGGTWEDCRSEINEHYMDAHCDYRDDMGSKYETWIRFRVWHRLLDSVRSRMAKINLRPRHCDIAVVEVGYEEPKFRLDEFVEDLSKDAKRLVKMVLIPPFDLLLAARGSDEPISIRRGLKEVLKDMGWTAKRILESFNEIRRAL